MPSVEMWIAIAATSAFLGTLYQCVSALWIHLAAMKFFNAHSEIVRENAKATRLEIPWWRPVARRRRRKAELREAFSLLEEDEQAQVRDYDRDSLGWAFVLLGALIATVVSWGAAISA
jgi:hypothetical protein